MNLHFINTFNLLTDQLLAFRVRQHACYMFIVVARILVLEKIQGTKLKEDLDIDLIAVAKSPGQPFVVIIQINQIKMSAIDIGCSSVQPPPYPFPTIDICRSIIFH